MPQESTSTIDRINYPSTFRFTQLFSTMPMALHPAKIMLALCAITIIFISGKLLGEMFGPQVLPNEFTQFAAAKSTEDFDQWRQQQSKNNIQSLRALLTQNNYLSDQEVENLTKPENLNAAWSTARSAIIKYRLKQKEPWQADLAKPELTENEKTLIQSRIERINDRLNDDLNALKQITPQTIFNAALHNKLHVFSQFANHAVRFNLGLDQLNPDTRPTTTSAIGAFRLLCFSLPLWLWHAHALFLFIYLLIALIILSLFGGAISRIAIVEIAQQRRITAAQALSFSSKRFTSFLFSPIAPLAAIAAIALIISLGGWFFNFPLTNILLAFVFIFAIAAGFIIALMLIGWLAGVHLMYPALAAQGTDAFDAISRGYGYVFSRPWRYTLYTLISLIYGAFTYMLVGLFLFLILKITHSTTSAFVSTISDTQTISIFHAIWPQPTFGQLMYQPQWELLGVTQKISAVIIMVWVYLFIALVAAYALSYYYAAFSHIYLILRKYVDGTDPSDIYEEPVEFAPHNELDKVEPAPADTHQPST